MRYWSRITPLSGYYHDARNSLVTLLLADAIQSRLHCPSIFTITDRPQRYYNAVIIGSAHILQFARAGGGKCAVG